MVKHSAKALAFALLISSSATQAVGVYSDKAAFASAVGPSLQMEDWTSYAPGTALDGQTFRGVTYGSTSPEQLVVGSYHGAGWIIGYTRGNGQYASFSSETISFQFSEAVVAFGVALSQGNQSGQTNYSGASVWEVLIKPNGGIYFPQASYINSDFTGETYLGLTALNAGTEVEVRRVSSDANIVWDIRDIGWATAASVAEPSTYLLSVFGIVILWGWRSLHSSRVHMDSPHRR